MSNTAYTSHSGSNYIGTPRPLSRFDKLGTITLVPFMLFTVAHLQACVELSENFTFPEEVCSLFMHPKGGVIVSQALIGHYAQWLSSTAAL